MLSERLIQTSGLERQAASPLVSIIIPAYNAVATLAETLAAVQQQTFTDWEAIVVDDGSTDETVQAVRELVCHDGRIRIVRQPNGGASVARNAGIAQALGVWLLFLDADDLILPTHLDTLAGALRANPTAAASFSEWSYLTPDGRRMASGPLPETGDLFGGFAHTALFAIHACLVRRDLVHQAGGFDPSLRTCEDWDLWQRVARLGAPFVRCAGETAIYRMRPLSLSRNVERMLSDGLRVVEIGFSADPRVSHPAAIHKDGLKDGNLREAQIYVIVWVAGEMLGLGQDARDALRHIPEGTIESIDPSYVADSLYAAVVLTRCLAPDDWPAIWREVEGNVTAFLHALEARVNTPLLATRSLRMLEHHILDATAGVTPLTIGRTHAATVEVTTPIEDIDVPCGVERLLLAVTIEGDRIGELELPIYGDIVDGHLIADAIANRFAWQVLGRHLARTVYPDLTVERGESSARISRGETLLLETAGELDDLHEQVGWTVFLQELWDRPDWLNDHFYDPKATDASPGRTVKADERDWIAVELSDELPAIVTNRPVQVVPAVAGVLLGVITVEPDGRAITPQQLRAAIISSGSLELCRVCVREALLGRPLDSPTLRERLRSLARSRAPVRQIGEDGACPLLAGHVRIGAGSSPLFARRQPEPSLTGISRLAVVPANVTEDMRALAGRLSEPVVGESTSVDGWYVPEIVPLPRQAGQSMPERASDVAHTISTESRVPRRSGIAATAMRRVARKAGLIPPRAANGQAPDIQRPVDQESSATISNGLVPILMYHRVAPDGAPKMARYRVTPAAFEEQLAYLRGSGYTSATVEEITQSLETRRPLPGRRVVLTFDDAYVDFAEHAWPLLKRYEFDAILFAVSGCTGRTNEWDHHHGEVLSLLGWDDLRRLQSEGLTIGAHSVDHPPMTGLSPREVARQAAESRRVLQQELGIPVRTFAYPYGDRNEMVEHIVGACGYTLGFTCRSYLLHVNDAPLSLPRIEVQGNDPLATFVRNLTL